MLILISIDIQYLQNVVFSYKKESRGQNHSLSDSYYPIKKFLQANFPSPLPLSTIGKTLGKGPSLLNFDCLFQVKPNFSIDNIFFRKFQYENFNIFGELCITQSKIYDGAFIAKIVNRYVFSRKISIVDACLGSK